MKVVLRMDGRTDKGGAPLLMHNERLGDPLDKFARSLSEVSKKRNKTDADHLEVARREFLGGLYTNGNGPCIPAWNIIRCLQEGAKRHKLGKKTISSVFPIIQHADVIYDGPRDPDDLWKMRDTFSLRKGVGISGRKVMRTRPIFNDWVAELLVEVDSEELDLLDVQKSWRDSGKYIGIGDMRPVYGRFAADAISSDQWLRMTDGDVDSIWRASGSAIRRILESEKEMNKVHI